MTRTAAIAGYTSAQFLELLFELDDDIPDLIKAGAD
jgi:hypothetical protein